ncbi:hypothetical protein e112_247 [Escherichia phage vB_EcoM_112]|uniref:Uncharacterized protein n=1 Tax=Escherichia phage vB_EcoM_112 TaxID=1495285 RepID=A0A023ZW97_9CAUD|nr:hypothetical protein e112_247 [Escherichia phage vB_EcoM_112]AHY83435.1 hypothetical protein e112_247 [Escherichia phage vB_EcoM_112]
MILRFKDTSGVVLFTLPNPSELEVPGPNQPIIIYGKKYYTHKMTREYFDNKISTVKTSSDCYYDITVLTEKQYAELSPRGPFMPGSE